MALPPVSSLGSIGSVAELRRYPVKSLAGERLVSVAVDGRGLVGDRRWAVVDPDGKLGSSKSSRRFRRMDGLLELGVSSEPGGGLRIVFPDGRHISGDDPRIHEALSGHVGRPVELLPERSVSHFDDGPVHLVTTASLAALARHHGARVSTARLRANLLVDVAPADGTVEDGWVGRRLAIGPDLVLEIRDRMPRCVMVDLPQVGLPPAVGLLRTLGRVNDGTIGVVADVVAAGTVSVDDPVELLASASAERPVGRAPER